MARRLELVSKISSNGVKILVAPPCANSLLFGSWLHHAKTNVDAFTMVPTALYMFKIRTLRSNRHLYGEHNAKLPFTDWCGRITGGIRFTKPEIRWGTMEPRVHGATELEPEHKEGGLSTMESFEFFRLNNSPLSGKMG